jgi:uncharacterized protein YbbK (DUF523 family)
MIVVSECLLGINCKYNGENNACKSLINLSKKGCVIPVCPEQLGGLPTPRIPAEIIGSKVFNKMGKDVTNNFIKGADEAMKLVNLVKPKFIVLKANSPSCGYKKIYDGNFCGQIVDGNGIFAQKLIDKNYNIITEKDLDEKMLKKLEEINEG